ncbi:MAG: hypothetical protein KDB69_00290, partial [Acidimicrobiia bacterium]|nr:hypothetical protein [Acidimicrobiia bacterium]
EEAMNGDLASVFERLRIQLHRFVDHERFEEAGDVRDRWTALSSAVGDQIAWRSLRRAGRVVATDTDGARIEIDNGRFVRMMVATDQLPLLQASLGDDRLPHTMAELEEARMLWGWLATPGVRFDLITGTLGVPAYRVPDVDELRRPPNPVEPTRPVEAAPPRPG